jgi:rubrerythrin
MSCSCGDPLKEWVCDTCGHYVDGHETPDQCPTPDCHGTLKPAPV